MNKAQRKAVQIAAVVSLLMLLFPPFEYFQPIMFTGQEAYDLKYEFILEGSLENINVLYLLIQLAVLWFICGLFSNAFK